MEEFYLEEPSIKRKNEAIEFIDEFYKYGSQIHGVGGLSSSLKESSYEEWINECENMKDNEFIKALIELVGRHGCTLDEIKELFHSYSDKIVTEPVDNGEFDVMVRFDDGSDPYYYCFKDEGCHIIYHRFLPEDYADFGF